MRTKLLSVVVLVFIAGCVGPEAEKLAICTGRATLQDSLASLDSNTAQIKPFRANGQCFATYNEDGKKHKEEFSFKLWFNPPNELRFFGDVAFNARGLDIGCNETEFWFAAKPKELGNSFWWGKWSEQKNTFAGFGSKMLLDSLCKITIANPQDWSLSNEGPFDILSEQSQGKIVKKFYIYCCDYRIRKIEYFNEGNVSAVLEMRDYRKIFDGSLFPSELMLRDFNYEGKESLIRIVFGTVKGYGYTSQKRTAYFERPTDLNGFEHIYRAANGGLNEKQK